VFSQFLFDDHIKSRLIKDARFFRQEKDKVSNRYPFDRAERFVRDIRKLGVSEAGLTVLDQFRQLITEIGNAMGYVRMVRAGGMHYAVAALERAPGICELPDLTTHVAEFQDDITGKNLGAFSEVGEAFAATVASQSPLTLHSVSATSILTQVVGRLNASFEEGATYFQMLEAVFAEEMRSPKNSHLQTFFILVPALTINFVEHLLAAKDKLQRGQRCHCELNWVPASTHCILHKNKSPCTAGQLSPTTVSQWGLRTSSTSSIKQPILRPSTGSSA